MRQTRILKISRRPRAPEPSLIPLPVEALTDTTAAEALIDAIDVLLQDVAEA